MKLSTSDMYALGAFAICLPLAVWVYWESQRQDATEGVVPAPAVEISDDQRVLVCRAVTASISDVNFSDVTGTAGSSETVTTAYRRSDTDGIQQTKCRFEGRRVIWANVDGGRLQRWRDHPDDERIYWSLTPTEVSIEQDWGDGSVSLETYGLP